MIIFCSERRAIKIWLLPRATEIYATVSSKKTTRSKRQKTSSFLYKDLTVIETYLLIQEQPRFCLKVNAHNILLLDALSAPIVSFKPKPCKEGSFHWAFYIYFQKVMILCNIPLQFTRAGARSQSVCFTLPVSDFK